MNLNGFKARLQELLEPVRKGVISLSSREKIVVGSLIAIVILTAIYYLCSSISQSFQDQTEALAKAREEAGQVEPLLRTYLEQLKRRDLIKDRFREVEFKEGVISHLEELAQRKAGLAQGEFSITTNPNTRSFGEDFEQVAYTIKLNKLNNLPGLVELLKELVEGPRPMLLTGLNITKQRGINILQVDIDVSAIKKKN